MMAKVRRRLIAVSSSFTVRKSSNGVAHNHPNSFALPRRSLHRLNDGLIPWCRADGIEIAVVFEPGLVSPALFDCMLECGESVVSPAESGKGARGVVQEHGIFLIDRDRSLGQLDSSLLVADVCVCNPAKYERPGICRVQLELMIDQVDLPPIRGI